MKDTIIFNKECKGRDKNMDEVLTIPVKIKVEVSNLRTIIETTVIDCKHVSSPYNSRAQLCKVTKDEVFCPYSVDLPYITDKHYGDKK